MRMCNFWAQNGPFPQRIFSENMLMSLFSLIHAYLHAKNQSQILIVKCWLLKNTEISLAESHFLAITWEPDFSQACSFLKMLMNHKNFNFTQIPGKNKDVIFLKSPKSMFLGHFWPFLVIFAWPGLFPKNPALSHTTIYGPLTPC